MSSESQLENVQRDDYISPPVSSLSHFQAHSSEMSICSIPRRMYTGQTVYIRLDCLQTTELFQKLCQTSRHSTSTVVNRTHPPLERCEQRVAAESGDDELSEGGKMANTRWEWRRGRPAVTQLDEVTACRSIGCSVYAAVWFACSAHFHMCSLHVSRTAVCLWSREKTLQLVACVLLHFSEA